MDRLLAPVVIDRRLSSGPTAGRHGAPASFDPSAAGHTTTIATTKPGHAKEYGSAFAGGFLRYLETGELSDVIVEVITDATSPTPVVRDPSPSVTIRLAPPSPERPSSLHPPHPSPPPRSPLSSSLNSSPRCNPATACSFHLGEFRLHGLLLARHSAFFTAALGQAHFADSAARRIRLTLDPAAAPAWPTLVEFMYTDRVCLDGDSALPLLALSRQLLVSELDAYCTDYICGRLCADNCMSHLRAAVRFMLHDLHAECVALAAQSFPLLYDSDLSGLPPASLLEILTHPLLQVHCELQVVEAVTRYLATTTVDPETQRVLSSQIRFPYLDNATIARLAVQPSIALSAAAVGGVGDGGSRSDPDPAAASATTAATGGAGISTHASVEVAADAPAASAPDPALATHGSSAAALRGLDGSRVEVEEASEGTGAAAAEAGDSSNSGGESGDSIAAAGSDGSGDSGLLSASSSSCSSPRSASGGAGGQWLSYSSHPRAQSHRRHGHDAPQPQRSDVDGPAAATATPAGECAGGGDTAASHHPQHPPLLPRDMTLEGALARLVAMEFCNSLPSPQPSRGGLSGHVHHHHHHPHASVPCSLGGGAGGSLQLRHPYFHPYQQYQFQYQLGAGAAAASGGQAAQANGGRRQLELFPVSGAGQQPQQQQQLAAGGGGGGGPQAHALAHGMYYNHPAGAAGPPPPQQQELQPQHPAAALPRGFSTAGGSGDGVVGGGGAAATAGGGAVVDAAAVLTGFGLPSPRLSYCCNVVHGLPGGCAWVDVALEALWEHLVPYIIVQVSGCAEGNPRNVISSDPDCFFETNDSSDPLPWLEVQLPHNVHVLQLHRFTFLHGHRRVGYYRARNFKTQVAVRPASEPPRSPTAAAAAAASAGGAAAAGGSAAAGNAAQRPGQGLGPAGSATPVAAAPFAPSGCRYVDLTTRMAEQFDVGVLSGATAVGPWRVLRIQATGAQEDGVHRLCVRGLKMYGVARVDLMHQADGFVVQPHWVLGARVDAAGAAAVGGGGGGGSSSSGGALAAGFTYIGGGAGASGRAALGGGGGLAQWAGFHPGP